MISREELEELRVKYAALEELRRTREEAIRQGLNAFPPAEAATRRVLMRDLAARFPGALRELDEATAEELAARVRLLDSALDSGVFVPWMLAAALFHRRLRDELVKRRLSPERPPTGRVLDAIWDAVANELGVTAREAERLVYPHAPPRGTRTER